MIFFLSLFLAIQTEVIRNKAFYGQASLEKSVKSKAWSELTKIRYQNSYVLWNFWKNLSFSRIYANQQKATEVWSTSFVRTQTLYETFPVHLELTVSGVIEIPS